jgi:hypothetical protein
LDFDVPSKRWFIFNSSDSKIGASTVRAANKKPECCVLWFLLSSGEPIRTTDLRVMSQNPESVPFVRRALQISRPDELWSMLAGHAAVANRYSYSICFTWVRQVLFLAFLHSSFQFNLFKSIFSWGMRPP